MFLEVAMRTVALRWQTSLLRCPSSDIGSRPEGADATPLDARRWDLLKLKN
jgi:hypothetical protein